MSQVVFLKKQEYYASCSETFFILMLKTNHKNFKSSYHGYM